jgi:hypothetical protein
MGKMRSRILATALKTNGGTANMRLSYDSTLRRNQAERSKKSIHAPFLVTLVVFAMGQPVSAKEDCHRKEICDYYRPPPYCHTIDVCTIVPMSGQGATIVLKGLTKEQIPRVLEQLNVK